MKKWYKQITPFAIVCAVIVVGVLYSLIASLNDAVEVKYMYLMLLLPIFIALIIVDLILRFAIKKKTWIWIIEILLFFISLYFWIVQE